jgi:23S rRNA pseudouridine2605 synthase
MAKKQPKKPGKPFWEPFGKEAPKASKPKKKHVERASRRKKIRSKRDEEEQQKRERASLGPQAWEEQYLIRLNRFLGQAGVCARREADKLIAAGKVKVNGKVVKEMGTKINPRKDIVEYEGKKLRPQNLVYYLYNKPKNTLVTTKDDRGRTTVIDQIEGKTSERVYPIGRLERNTTGLLILTNDGKLAKKLTDPSQKVRNLYHVRLDKDFEEQHFQSMLKGVELEDGPATADKISYVKGEDLNQVGIEISMIRNRVVHRMFTALGYKIISLDRVSIAHLTKKRLPRGQWRELTEQEVSFLKMV